MKATTAKQARNSRFQKGSGVYKCRACGHNTRAVGNGDCEHLQLCEICFDIGGLENAVADGCATEADKQMLADLEAALAARNAKKTAAGVAVVAAVTEEGPYPPPAEAGAAAMEQGRDRTAILQRPDGRYVLGSRKAGTAKGYKFIARAARVAE